MNQGIAMPENVNFNDLSIYLDETKQKVLASCSAEGDRNAITPEEFRQLINEAGYGAYQIPQVSLEDAAAKYNSGEAFEITVGKAVDGKFSIRTDANLMVAYLSCSLPQGGAPVQMQDVLQEAARKGITVPLDVEAIERTLREGADNVLIARGQPPVAGENGRLQSLIPAMKEKSPRIDENGLADFRELGDIFTVQAGDVLIRRIPATEGIPGHTVTGRVLPAKPGKNITFASKLEGVIPDPNDPDVLIAAISGCPVIVKNGVSVDPVYSVKNVDLHCGNISYMGAVHVTGDVHTDMTIKASGDIYVDGTVENAMLEAGGDIIVKGGIIGSSELHTKPNEKFHAAIKCNGTCTARFVQNTHISAGNGIFIHDVAMLSELTALHQIIVGDQGSRKGDIIGGTTRATMLVKAKNIGSPDYLKTQVIAGPDMLLQERHNASVKAYADAAQKLGDIIKLLELARQNPGRLPPETLKTAEATRDALNAEMETLVENEMELRKEIDLANKAQVIVEKRVFGGTDIHIGSKHYRTTEEREGGVFHLNEDGEIDFD